MPKLKIYLADLDHFFPGNRITVPLNVGYIASYCKSIYGNEVDISLFKHPMDLMQKLRSSPPQILGLSFYMWNESLTLKIIECCKKISPSTLTVIGGSSIARISENYKTLLTDNPSLDVVVLDQGEKSFANIMGRVLSKGFDARSIFSKSISGCAIRCGNKASIERADIENDFNVLKIIPSPYLMGYLDRFLEEGLVPLLETTRGCPFSCAYCDQGDIFFSKVIGREEGIIYDELRYLLSNSRTKELCVTDSNFGILGERDLRISSFMLELFRKYGFPFITDCSSPLKKNKTSIQTMTNISKITGTLYFGLQTLTEEVLINSDRKNISINILKELTSIAKTENISVAADLIFGLPGETLQSFMKTLSDLFNMGLEKPGIVQLRLLPGTVLSERDREKNKYVSRFRPFNNRFGEYELIPGEKPARIIETEEIVVQSRSFDFNNYLKMREYGFLVELFSVYGAFSETILYLSSRGINITETINNILENYNGYPELVSLFDDYREYSKRELFKSEESLINKLCKEDEQWNNLLSSKGNYFKINLGFVGYCLFEGVGLLDHIAEIISVYVNNELPEEEHENYYEVLNYDKKRRIIPHKAKSRLKSTDIKKDIFFEEQFDYDNWKINNFSGQLTKHKLKKSVKKTYYIENFMDLIKSIEKYSMMSNLNFYERILMYAPKVSLLRLSAINN